MALMPEDLENKRFTPVRFTEGYDMDEVDNYLDHDVTPRLQELIDENERLKKELDEANERIARLESEGAHTRGADTQEGADQVAEDSALAADEDAVVVDPAAAPAGQDAPVVADETVAESSAVETAPQSAATDASDESAAGIIALAHRLHDEHVRNGQAERDRLIEEATAESRRIVGEAEETSRTTLENLTHQKAELETSIDSLRTFERDYRNRLRNYLENQLHELDAAGTQDKQGSDGL